MSPHASAERTLERPNNRGNNVNRTATLTLDGKEGAKVRLPRTPKQILGRGMTRAWSMDRERPALQRGEKAMKTMSPIHSGEDVVAFLKGQHKQVKALFDEVLVSKGTEREKAFLRLRRMMAVHETAEEEIVHPVARRVVPNGDAIVRRRLSEESQAKTALAELEKLDFASGNFEARFRTLQADVIAHAESEESEEFSKLSDQLDANQLARMKKAAELAEAVAPTRPHPAVGSATANLLVGPFASMIDRARDALSAKT